MAAEIEIRMPNYPACWDTCGACYSGSVEVADVLVRPGDRLSIDDPLIELELDKTTLEIPTTHAGEVVAGVAQRQLGGLEVVGVHVAAGDSIAQGDLIATLRGT